MRGKKGGGGEKTAQLSRMHPPAFKKKGMGERERKEGEDDCALL